MGNRRPPNADEKIASLLLEVWALRGAPIPFRIAQAMTADQICSLVQWHHTTPHVWLPELAAQRGEALDENHPCLLQAVLIMEHRRLTALQAPILAKVKRSIARRSGQAKPKSKIRSKGFPTKEERQRLKEQYRRPS